MDPALPAPLDAPAALAPPGLGLPPFEEPASRVLPPLPVAAPPLDVPPCMLAPLFVPADVLLPAAPPPAGASLPHAATERASDAPTARIRHRQVRASTHVADRI
jgi:hypothetical protein